LGPKGRAKPGQKGVGILWETILFITLKGKIWKEGRIRFGGSNSGGGLCSGRAEFFGLVGLRAGGGRLRLEVWALPEVVG